MSRQERIEQFGKSWVDFFQNLLTEIEKEQEKINEKLKTIEQEQEEEIKQQDEFDKGLVLVLETLKEEVVAKDELHKMNQKYDKEREKRRELGKAFLGFRSKQNTKNEEIDEKMKELNEKNENLSQELEDAIKSIEQLNKSLNELRKQNVQLMEENTNLKQLEANWNKHINDDTRHIKRVTGPTPQSQAKASEVKHQRTEETNIKVFRAIFGYLQQAQDKTRVDMSWLLKTTGLSESTIRQTVKELQEGKLNNNVQKIQGGFLLYGLPVPSDFITWKAKANFFNVAR